MRFISMHKTNADNEAGKPPGMEVIAAMGALVGEMVKAGAFMSGEGLGPSSRGVRLVFEGGQMRRIPGPFAGANELPMAFTIVKVRDIEQAVHWALRHARAFGFDTGAGEIDVRPVHEPWDMGLAPPSPAGSDSRYMILLKADRRSESGAPLGPKLVAALHQLHREMQGAGVMLAGEGIRPSSEGVRLNFRGDARYITDGPFTESKELIAGYCIFEVKSRAEVVAWCTPFAKILGDVEVDIRPLYEPADLA